MNGGSYGLRRSDVLHMTIRELNREQLTKVKQRYLIQLADSGEFAEIVGRDYDEPSWDDLARADEIVPDDVVFRNYEGYFFIKEDF